MRTDERSRRQRQIVNADEVPAGLELLRRPQAAAVCNASLDSFDRHIRPHLRSVRVGRVETWSRSEVRRWIADQEGNNEKEEQ